jgi:hypothetical protein
MTKPSWFALAAGCIVTAGFPAAAEVVLTANDMSSATFIAAPGEYISICSWNNGVSEPSSATSRPVNLTLEILDGVTGAVLAQNQITLPPLGSVAHPPSPCAQYNVPPLTTPAVPPQGTLFIGVVLVNPQPGACTTCPILPFLPLGVGLMASVNVYTPDTSGLPTNIRFIPVLHPPQPCAL